MKTRSDQFRPKMSQAEFEVMNVIWELGSATVTEVMDALNASRDTSLARGTVQVQLRRLEVKNWLKQEKRGSHKFIYSPTCGRCEASADIASDVTQRVFDGSCTNLVRCLYQQEKLSSNEIQRLRDLVKEMESQRDENA